MACLDTSAIIDLSGRSGARRSRSARDVLRSLSSGGEDLVTTRFCIAELWVGVERSDDSDAEHAKLEKLIDPLAVLEFGDRSARVFGRILAHLQTQGVVIGDMDTLIATVCLEAGHSIVTRNTKHFSRVPGLSVVGY